MVGRWELEKLEVETLASFASSFSDGPGVGVEGECNFGLVVRRLLDCQLADGNLGSDPVGADAEMCQYEDLRRLYQVT
jgi:hypothetical protein